jgi:hypothetical protein
LTRSGRSWLSESMAKFLRDKTERADAGLDLGTAL